MLKCLRNEFKIRVDLALYGLIYLEIHEFYFIGYDNEYGEIGRLSFWE